MTRTRRAAAIPGGLAVLAFALAFAQRPGWATSDTKINLYVDPLRFLADVASMWTSSGQLGDVQTGQYVGYLFPMGPFYALGHLLGLAPWVAQRLWLGTLLALAAWGAVRMIDAFSARPRGAGALVAGLVMILNPFVVTYANRTTVTLLAYAALPWLLVCVHRGIADAPARPAQRRLAAWRWPAAIALLVAASGAGVNAAVTAWMLLGPLLLVLYEWRVLGADGRAAGGLVLRSALLIALTSLWWVIPAEIQSHYGINFLPFTEQPGTVWGTTSATEALRLMSFWLSYVGVGFAGRPLPYFADAPTLLFSVPVVLATLLLPAVALAGFITARRTRYGPFLLALALLAVVILTAGFPDGTPLRHGLYFVYNRVPAVRFLRASYKAGPLLAVALAGLAGLGADALWRHLGRRPSASLLRAASALAGLLVLTGAAWPLVSGTAQDPQVSYRRIPAAWRAAAHGLNRTLPANSRAFVLPGDLFSFYTWGGTTDPILPALTRRPVAERTEVPYADLRATDLEWTIDGLVHQQRLLPGQLRPLLSLAGARAVVTGTDDDLARSDAPAPADAARTLAAAGLSRPAASYGPLRRFAPTGDVSPPVTLPQVRRYDLPSARGIVRVETRSDPLIVDGSASAVAELAAFGALPAARPLLYSADQSPAGLRTEVTHGADLVISDSNRRQAFAGSRLEDDTGAVLTADEDVSADGFIFDPFGRGPAAETVAQYTQIASVTAPFSPQVPQYPQHAPFAALDGSTATDWEADPSLGRDRGALTVTFRAPRDVPYVDLVPSTAAGTVRGVTIAGRAFAVHPGVNRLRLGLRAVPSLTVALTDVRTAPGHGGAGGISELRIPGLAPTQALRLPTDATTALAGADLSHAGLSYLFERVTGDQPFARDPAAPAPPGLRAPGDAETVMRRIFDVPAARRFTATAWVTPGARTADDALDRLAGYRGRVRATSSSRFAGMPRYRASAALDGDASTAWIADAGPGQVARLHVAVTGAPMTLRTLRLTPPRPAVDRPASVRLSWAGGATGALSVRSGGRVALPRPVRTRAFTLEILRATPVPGATAAQRRAVGIAELDGVRGLPRVRIAARADVTAPCGAARLSVAGRTIALRVQGAAAAFASGTPLPARGCGAPVALSAGTATLTVAPGPLTVDDLRLSSPAPQPITPAPGGGTVRSAGVAGRGHYEGVRLDIRGPSWLVLGEGYSAGWRATCDGRSLGAPVPIDAAANGWPVNRGCTRVALNFAPQRAARIGYAISILAALVCLLLLAAGMVAARRSVTRDPAPSSESQPERPRPAQPAPARPGIAATAGLAIVAGAAFGFVFGYVAGACAALAAAIILARGIGARPLTVAACALLGLVVPVLYLLTPTDPGAGNHDAYPLRHLTAHWVGVAALGLLTAALARSLPGARRPAAGGDP